MFNSRPHDGDERNTQRKSSIVGITELQYTAIDATEQYAVAQTVAKAVTFALGQAIAQTVAQTLAQTVAQTLGGS